MPGPPVAYHEAIPTIVVVGVVTLPEPDGAGDAGAPAVAAFLGADTPTWVSPPAPTGRRVLADGGRGVAAAGTTASVGRTVGCCIPSDTGRSIHRRLDWGTET
jgi:hypothetical protein